MNVEILLTAQKYENYSFYKDGKLNTDQPKWKAKGVAHFMVEVDNGWLMYTENEDIKKRFEKVIENQSNGYMWYDYVDHEILWYGIQKINGVIE